MLLALVCVPPLLGLLAYFLPGRALRRAALPLAGGAHLACVLDLLFGPAPLPALPDFAGLRLDAPGSLVLLVSSVLFFVCSIYALAYLKTIHEWDERRLIPCLLALLGAAGLVASARHLGLVWVAVEAATLLAAPMIYYSRQAGSLEATWKYLMIGGVGVALALLGTFFLGYAALQSGRPSGLDLDSLLATAATLSKPWLKLAFVFLLVGYGTKMGLAPMHTWKPDAYGESSGMAGTLLAGVLTSCSFLALFRVQQLMVAAGEGAYSGPLLVGIGLVSMAVAGAFVIGQRDLKRLLAYSSVEHMGILALGLGLGGVAVFAAALHLVFNALTKGALFLCAGNIHRAFASKHLDQVQGAGRLLPWSGGIFLAGFLAITGSPPFAPFISEFTLLTGAFNAGHWAVAAAFLALLMLVFLGMGEAVLGALLGTPPAESRRSGERDSLLSVLPPLALMALVLMLGFWIPAPLRRLATDTAGLLGTKP